MRNYRSSGPCVCSKTVKRYLRKRDTLYNMRRLHGAIKRASLK